jgi:hypothetical protein
MTGSFHKFYDYQLYNKASGQWSCYAVITSAACIPAVSLLYLAHIAGHFLSAALLHGTWAELSRPLRPFCGTVVCL